MKKETDKAADKLYNLSLLEELDDPAYVVDVLGFFLENAPKDMNELLPLTEQKDWPAVHKKAHKIKGAAAMLQSIRLAEMLSAIELHAKAEKDPEKIPEMVKEAFDLFEALQTQLEAELDRLKKELGSGS